MNVSNLSQEVELFIPPLEKRHFREPQRYFVKPNDNGTMRFHKIVFPGPEYAVSIRIVPFNKKTLTLYVRYAQRPTLEHYNFTSSTDVNYTLSVSMGTCQYWNVTADAWSTEGCRVCSRRLLLALNIRLNSSLNNRLNCRDSRRLVKVCVTWVLSERIHYTAYYPLNYDMVQRVYRISNSNVDS